jgi:hypothetical protein
VEAPADAVELVGPRGRGLRLPAICNEFSHFTTVLDYFKAWQTNLSHFTSVLIISKLDKRISPILRGF